MHHPRGLHLEHLLPVTHVLHVLLAHCLQHSYAPLYILSMVMLCQLKLGIPERGNSVHL